MSKSSLEPVWLIEATYAPDAAESRLPIRAEHAARLLELKAQGTIIEAGAYPDVSASVLMLRAASQEAALEICRQDVYTRNGVWVEFRIRPFNRLVPDT
jgi:uncharacterized protein YciI